MNYALSYKQYKEKHGFEALQPKAVLFDMDGVLYDSMPNHAVAWQQSMAKFGIVMTRHDAYATEGQRGIDTIRQMVKQQQGRDITEQEAQVMYDEKTRLFHLMDEAPLMPGALQLMEQMRAAGLAIGVVTGSGQRPLIERLLSDYGEFLQRDHIVTAYDVSRGKPYPDPYLKGLQLMGDLKPWQALVVENAPLGVQAAVAARIYTICVNSGHLPLSLLRQHRPDVIFSSMRQLSSQWPLLCQLRHRSQDDMWQARWQEYMAFLDKNQRRPSKYADEERPLIDWLKYNRKLMARGKLQADRVARLELIEQRNVALRRYNQYS